MNATLQRCGLESPEQVKSICAGLFGNELRGTAFQVHLKTDPKKVTRILQMRAEGRIIREIAKEIGISKTTVVEILSDRAKGMK